MPYGYPTGQPGGAGATLTGFADTYLHARKQFADEDLEAETLRYRQLQAEQLQQEMQSRQSSDQGFQSLAGQPAPEPMTLAEGQAPTSGQNPQPTPGQAPDAAGATPGEPGGAAGPGAAPTGQAPTPGLPPIQQSILTYEQAVKRLPGGAKQFWDMQKNNPQGLRAMGYLSPSEVDQRRQVAAIDQSGRGFDEEINRLAKSGDPADDSLYHITKAAKYERMAQVSADPKEKEYYRQLMDHERDVAKELRTDQRAREEAVGLRQEADAAMAQFRKTGSPEDHDAVIAVARKMQTNKSTAGDAQSLLGAVQQGNNKLLTDPDLQGQLQIRNGVDTYIHDHPGTDPDDAWVQVVQAGAGNTLIREAAMKDAVTSQNPRKLMALKLPPDLKSEDARLAEYQTAEDKIAPGSPGYTDRLSQHIRINHENRTNGTLNVMAGRELNNQIQALDEQITEKQQEYDGYKADNTLSAHPDVATDLANLKAERQKRADLLIQYGGRQGAGRGGSLAADKLQDSRDSKTMATLEKAVKSFEDRKKATGDYFMLRPADKAAFDADYAAAKKKRDDFAAKIQAKSGVAPTAPPKRPVLNIPPRPGFTVMRKGDQNIYVPNDKVAEAQKRGAILAGQ
jgi:hypothetical protein